MLKVCLIRLTMIIKDERPLPIGKNKKVIGMFKDELGGNLSVSLGLKNVEILV